LTARNSNLVILEFSAMSQVQVQVWHCLTNRVWVGHELNSTHESQVFHILVLFTIS